MPWNSYPYPCTSNVHPARRFAYSSASLSPTIQEFEGIPSKVKVGESLQLLNEIDESFKLKFNYWFRAKGIAIKTI